MLFPCSVKLYWFIQQRGNCLFRYIVIYSFKYRKCNFKSIKLSISWWVEFTILGRLIGFAIKHTVSSLARAHAHVPGSGYVTLRECAEEPPPLLLQPLLQASSEPIHGTLTTCSQNKVILWHHSLVPLAEIGSVRLGSDGRSRLSHGFVCGCVEVSLEARHEFKMG